MGLFALLTPSGVWANQEMNSAVPSDAVEKLRMHILSTDGFSEAQAFLSTERTRLLALFDNSFYA